MSYTMVRLLPGREKSVLNHHPWVFSRGLAPISGRIQDGDLVTLADHEGKPLAVGYLNRKSEITVRILSWNPKQKIDAEFFKQRLNTAWQLRKDLHDPQQTTALRLVYSENDFLPGLILDRFGDYLVMQLGTLGMERQRDVIIAAIQELFSNLAPNLIERSDGPARKHEGLEDKVCLVHGQWPESEAVLVRENGLPFLCPIGSGQKTGFYCDQRLNRDLLSALLKPGDKILNAFSYIGGFGVYCAAKGAGQVINVDSSEVALKWGDQSFAQLCQERPELFCQWANVNEDAFTLFRKWETDPAILASFDLVIVDPPKFVQNKRRLETALRGYKDINRLAFKFVKSGGYYATFSCSGHVEPDLFQKVIFAAAREANRNVQVIQFLFQAPDHPVSLDFPEGLYLKGLLCRVLD